MEEQNSGFIKFWKEYVDSEGVIHYSIINQKFISFLEGKGYRKLVVNKDFILVKIKDNSIVSVTKEHLVREEVKNLLKAENKLTVLELFMKTDYLSKKHIENIDSISIDFNSESDSMAVVYFKNGVFVITRDNIECIPYQLYDRYIWEDQILNRDFNIKSFDDCEFKKFCFNIAGQKEDRFLALETLIGYLLHSHKDPTLTKAVVLIDEDIDTESKASNGGTGKSLVAEAIKKLIPTLRKNGKLLKANDKFLFADVEPHHKLIVFDDVRDDFPFELLYSMLTGDMPIEKKYKNPVVMDFKDVPKVMITSNYVVIGTGGNSEERRKVTFEVNSYYRTVTSILDEFGHRFFDDWDENEWSKFDNFMVSCLQRYLTHGLIEAPSINEKANRLIQETNKDFVDFMDKIIANPRQCFYNQKDSDVRYDKATLYSSFIENNKEYSKTVSQITFKQWIDKYCESNGIKYEHKKSNGNAYVYLFNILHNDPNQDNFYNDNIILP